MLSLEQSQKEFIQTIYKVDDNNNFTPITIICSNREFDSSDYCDANDNDYCADYGLPNDPNFNWEACGYAGIDVIDLD